MTVGEPSEDEDLAADLEVFQRNLADLREDLGIGFKAMGARLSKLEKLLLPDGPVSGSKNIFNRMVRLPMTEVPRADRLRGFLYALHLSEDDRAAWEQRRRGLARRFEDASAEAATYGAGLEIVPGLSELVPSADPPEDSGVAEEMNVDENAAAAAGRSAASEEDRENGSGEDVVAEPVPPRKRSRRRVSMIVVGVLLIVAAGIVVPITISEGSASAPPPAAVSGTVVCVSGAEVAGVYVKAPGGGFVRDLHPVVGDPSRADFGYNLPPDTPYAVHVGCGKLPGNDWAKEDWSDEVRGSNLVFTCVDNRVAFYGSCSSSGE
jgi:hypothetical protein